MTRTDAIARAREQLRSGAFLRDLESPRGLRDRESAVRPGCSQHAPDEHILLSVTEEALGIMAGLFWISVKCRARSRLVHNRDHRRKSHF
jgi:hypothetical protein